MRLDVCACGAASAELLYANGGSILNGGFCLDSNILDRYAWLVDNGVTTVVESWACGDSVEIDADGPLQDWYARNYDLTIVRSAGDANSAVACAFLHNGLCVGGVKVDRTYDSGLSSWHNPSDFPHHDREEPDLTALSGIGTEVLAMDDAALINGTRDYWVGSGSGGTSFAAPAVGAAVALFKDVCNGRAPGSLPEIVVRAGVMAAAYLADPAGDGGYSTPEANCVPEDPSCDKHDGAELLYGAALMDLCGFNLTGNKSTIGVVPVDPVGGRGRPPSTPPDGKCGGGAVSGLGLGAVQLNAGEKLRAVISWNTCARYRTHGEGNSVADIDLWLFNRSTNQWATRSNGSLARSASYDDNNEGFEFESAGGGNFEPYVVWNNGQQPWFSQAVEPVGFAIISGPNIPRP